MNTTQEHILIADIADDIVLTKEGGAALVLETTSLNFSLLSAKEQEATIYAFASLLNSLSFSVQVVVRTHKKDVSDYLDYLAGEEHKQNNSKLKGLMTSYRVFVQNMVKKRHVLEKQFLFVIPFYPAELGLAGGLSGFGLVKRRARVPYPKGYVVKKAKTALYPRRDHLIRQCGRLGLKLRQLTTRELADLFFNIYNINQTLNSNGQY